MKELSDVSPENKNNNELYIVNLKYELDRAKQSYLFSETIWNEKEESLNSIIEEQKQVISLLESLLKSNQQFYDSLQNRILSKEESLNTLNKDIDKTLADTGTQIELLIKNIEKAERALTEKNAELDEQTAKLSERERRIVFLEKALDETKQTQDAALLQVKVLEESLAETRRHRDGFRRARDNLQELIDNQTKEVLAVKDELERSVADTSRQKADLESSVAELARQKVGLERKVVETVRLYEAGKQARETLQQKLDQQNGLLYDNEQMLARHLDEIGSMRKAESELNRHLDELRRSCEREKEQRARHQQSAGRLATTVSNLQRENEHLQGLVKQLNESNAEQERLATELKDKLEQQRILNASAFESRLVREKDNYNRELSELEKNLSVERENVSILKAQYNTLEAKYERASVNLSGLFARETRYKQNIAALQAQTVQEKEKAFQTISYQLGYALVQAGTSFSGFFRLPGQLLRIRKYARARRIEKARKRAINIESKSPGGADPAFPAPTLLEAKEALPLPIQAATQKLRIAAIMDEFTFHSYKPEADVLQLHPENAIDQLREFKPDMFFIESAWNGLDGLWKTKISNADVAVLDVIDWCKQNNVPTLFWNKEDPVHFSTFLPVASRVDVVFTTDVDCLPKYKAAIGHNRVYLLPFAAQPLTHNPIEKYKRKDAFNFAGSYYLRYPERQRDFASLIDTVKEFRPLDIYDRNFENPHPHYLFPDKYSQYILGSLPFEEIDKAYKGYRYGINMNTIKQSQTMFARRVFELLASNTVVVSNFSRGVRLMFGDLVISSDNAIEIRHRLENICNNELVYRKLRLLGLRKVMKEHTYAARLEYIGEKLLGRRAGESAPEVIILTSVRSQSEFDQFLLNRSRQTYSNIRVLVISDEPLDCTDPEVKQVKDIQSLINEMTAISEESFVAFFSNKDYYGANYILDLILARHYSKAHAVGKSSLYEKINDQIVLIKDGEQYSHTNALDARSSIVRRSVITRDMCEKLISSIDSYTLEVPGMLALDEFNYCRNVSSSGDADVSTVDDLSLVNQGMSLEQDISDIAADLKLRDASEQHTDLPQISAAEISQRIPKSTNPAVQWGMKRDAFTIVSNLPADKHIYLYSRKIYTRAEMNMVLNSQFKLESETTCQLKTVFEFQDASGKKLAHAMNHTGDYNSLAIPEDCRHIRFGLRIQGPGQATIDRLILGTYGQKPTAVVSTSPYLVLTKQYPDYDDLYKYGFLHTRVRGYKQYGLHVDVFRITNEKGNSYREFEDVDIVSGDGALLDATLSTGQYKNVLVHLLDEKMWAVLSKHLDKVHVTVWVHGAEIQVWQRRQFEFERMSTDEIKRQKRLSDKRLKFWQSILTNPHPNLELVFVSQYFAEEVSKDFSVDLSKVKYDIVHNYIDGTVFPYRQKSADHRRHLLSIRPYASRKYANDLTVKAIMELSKRDFFPDLEIALFGDGELFDETTRPLQGLKNVQLHKRFLSHREISDIHKDFGVFLTPTRMDSQGVSRDEAMSSGLVPITTNVTAIPEFVDQNCGMLVDGEDFMGMADAIEALYKSPEFFLELSKNASERVRRQSGLEQTIMKEIRIIERSGQQSVEV